jgi:hypothetical protein
MTKSCASLACNNLTQGRSGAKIEATTVAWAVIDPKPARVVHQDGSLIGEMIALGDDGLQVLVAHMPNFTEFGYRVESEGMPRLAGTVHVEHFDYTADSQPQKDVPQGRLESLNGRRARSSPTPCATSPCTSPQTFSPARKPASWSGRTAHVTSIPPAPCAPPSSSTISSTKKTCRAPSASSSTPAASPSSRRETKPPTAASNTTPRRCLRPLPHQRNPARGRKALSNEVPPAARGLGHRRRFLRRHLLLHRRVGASRQIPQGALLGRHLRRYSRRPSLPVSRAHHRAQTHPRLSPRWRKRPRQQVRQLAPRQPDDGRLIKYMNYDFRIDWTQCFHGSKGMSPTSPTPSAGSGAM